ncbi:DICT sensory domain-containing protein [Halohasta salina]|uniref:DICT sensory domain-containing protein n=1 Tax=Halohasta salina TaxID=2961621 RepID=UPI0020A5040B|nr:DICT sensory domain-containing protein [Halohasta salina]
MRRTPDTDSLGGIIDEVDTSSKTLLLVNLTDTAVEPQLSLLDRVFDTESVTVTERQLSEGAENLVCLVDDGEVVATSSWDDLKRAFLLVNTDRYRTGTKQIETGSFPDVLTGLDDIEFTVRGYPASNKEKLLLVVISRFIEFRALSAGAGSFDASFQLLSRLDDEFGTRQVYEWLADTAVDAHVYGVADDPTAAETLDLTVHATDDSELRRLWFVVFRPPEPDGDHVALIAEETAPNVWRGLWTYDPDRVRRAQSYARSTF